MESEKAWHIDYCYFNIIYLSGCSFHLHLKALCNSTSDSTNVWICFRTLSNTESIRLIQVWGLDKSKHSIKELVLNLSCLSGILIRLSKETPPPLIILMLYLPNSQIWATSLSELIALLFLANVYSNAVVGVGFSSLSRNRRITLLLPEFFEPEKNNSDSRCSIF